MDFLDTLAAIATGIGQGQAVLYQRQMLEQQRQDALRQQAVENALARQRLEQDAAELAWRQKQFEFEQEAKTKLAEMQAQERLSLLRALPGVEEIKIGEKQIGTYQPTMMLPQQQPAIQLGAGVPSARDRLFAGTALGGPRLEQVPIAPAQPIMEPVTKRVEDMTTPELVNYVARMGLADISWTDGKMTIKPRSYEEQLQAGLTTEQAKITASLGQTNLARAQLAYAKDVKTFDVAVAQDAATLQNTLMDIEAKKRAAILADPDVKRMLALSAWMEANPESVTTDVVKELRAKIEQNSAKIAQARVNVDWLRQYGLTPQQYAILHQVDAALARLSISKEYLGIAQQQAATRGKPTEATIRREWVGLVDDVINTYKENPAYTSEQAEAAIRKYAKAYRVPETDPYIQSALATIRQPKGSVNPVVDPLGLGVPY